MDKLHENHFHKKELLLYFCKFIENTVQVILLMKLYFQVLPQ